MLMTWCIVFLGLQEHGNFTHHETLILKLTSCIIVYNFIICHMCYPCHLHFFKQRSEEKKFTLSLVEVLRHCFMAKSWITLPNSPADEKSFTVFWILPSQKYPCLKSYPFAGSFLIHHTNPFSDSIEKSQVNASFLFKVCPSKGS